MTKPWGYSYVLAALRRIQRWSPEHKQARETAKVGKDLYRCAKCGIPQPRKETAVDHIFPVIDPSIGFFDWNTLFRRMFCPANELQVLCKTCHKGKSNAENVIRRKIKREAKNVR